MFWYKVSVYTTEKKIVLNVRGPSKEAVLELILALNPDLMSVYIEEVNASTN